METAVKVGTGAALGAAIGGGAGAIAGGCTAGPGGAVVGAQAGATAGSGIGSAVGGGAAAAHIVYEESGVKKDLARETNKAASDIKSQSKRGASIGGKRLW